MYTKPCCELHLNKEPVSFNDKIEHVLMPVKYLSTEEREFRTHNMKTCKDCYFGQALLLENYKDLTLGWGKCESINHSHLLKTAKRNYMISKCTFGPVFRFDNINDTKIRCYCCLMANKK